MVGGLTVGVPERAITTQLRTLGSQHSCHKTWARMLGLFRKEKSRMRNVQNQKRLAGRHTGKGEDASQCRGETRVNAVGWSCLLPKGETKPDTVGHTWNSNTEFWASLG